jgi:hypothetical protein
MSVIHKEIVMSNAISLERVTCKSTYDGEAGD